MRGFGDAPKSDPLAPCKGQAVKAADEGAKALPKPKGGPLKLTEGAKALPKPEVGPLKPTEGAKGLSKPKGGPLKLTEGAKGLPKPEVGPLKPTEGAEGLSKPKGGPTTAPPNIEPSPALCGTDAGATETSEANGFMED